MPHEVMARFHWCLRFIEVIEILLAETKKEDFDGLPERSEAYLVDMIEAKLERARTVWRTAQPQVTETGDAETIDEVEKRMIERTHDARLWVFSFSFPLKLDVYS